MKIHEYQGKAILAEYGVAVPQGKACFSVGEAVAAAAAIGGEKWVVKAQIHAGGRGKGGGVKIANNLDEVRAHASDILGMTLITHQTGPEGKVVKRLLVEEGAPIQDELYIGLVVDRSSQRVTVMASSEGGTEIETVAEETPELIHKVSVDPKTGLTTAEAEGLAGKIGIANNLVPEAGKLIQALYQAFWDKDASLAEINPLITTSDGRVIALDAKINFDESAMYRHPELADLRDLDEEDEDEIEAAKFGLNYISLDGSIGCLVNGAGLAMATMDIIKLYGASPANFLDVGGGATTEQVTEAFKLMLKNTNLKAILVNIFGGIMRCDVIAEGLVNAANEVDLAVPLVVRLEGTNVFGDQRNHHGRCGRESGRRRCRSLIMSILINKDSRVVTQGITGKTGMFHTHHSIEYANGKQCYVAGVTPKKGGQVVEGVPVFDSVAEAKAATQCNVSVIYVPPPFAAAAIDEAVDAGIEVVICITEGIPVKDMIKTRDHMQGSGTILVGPNCPGVITPEEIKIGIMPGYIHKKGRIGVVSRSGTLTYEVVDQLTKLGLGQSTCVGTGGDPVNGLKHLDVMKMFNDDPETDGVVMCGEIGGTDEEACAEWIADNMSKPVVGFIAGVTAPPGKRMGHAGAIIAGGKGTADEKIAALEAAGVNVTRNPSDMGKLMLDAIQE